MSDERKIKSARFTEDSNGCGPLLELPAAASHGEQWYTIIRDGAQIDFRRDECREIAASLLAFADGEP